MRNGTYRTTAGSEVVISGETGLRVETTFDWVEEPDACCDCVVETHPHDGQLNWSCDVCEGGSADLAWVGPVPVYPRGSSAPETTRVVLFVPLPLYGRIAAQGADILELVEEALDQRQRDRVNTRRLAEYVERPLP